MNATQARRRVARLAAELISDDESHDVFFLDGDGKPLPEADRERTMVALSALAHRLRLRGARD